MAYCCEELEHVWPALDGWSALEPSFQCCQNARDKAKRVRHSCMPWGGARHLGGMVRNNYALEIVLFQNRQNSNHIDIAFVDERLAILRNCSRHVAQMDVRNLSLAAVIVNRVVDIVPVISASVPTHSSSALLSLERSFSKR